MLRFFRWRDRKTFCVRGRVSEEDVRPHGAWLHLGANLGAAGTRLMVRASQQDLLDTAQGAAARLERLSPGFEVTNKPVGEAGVVAEFGGRFVSFIGAGFPLFHSISDRWPASCDWPAVAEIGDVALNILRNLDRD